MSKRYVTDLKGYSGPVDDISPYHYYQYVYWNLRGKGRRILYDWMRCAPTDATATIASWYYLRVRTVTGTLGWSSPVWVHLDKEA